MRTTLHKFDVPLRSVCWVWSDLIWHNCVDSHPGLYHKYPEVEHPGSADSLHSKLQVSRVSGTERHKNWVGLNEWPQRAPTDCLQWFTGATGVVYSYNHAGGQVGFKRHSRLSPLLVVMVVMVDLLDGVYNVFTHYICSQFINSQDYTNCIRTEDGFCGIEWKEKSGTSNGGRQMKDHKQFCLFFLFFSNLKSS